MLSTYSTCIRGAASDFVHAGAGAEGILGTGQKQPHREDGGRTSFQSNPVVSTELTLIKNGACKPGCPAAEWRSETVSSKPGSFKLFIHLHFLSFAIDLQGPFLRAPLVPTWQGSWLFAPLTRGVLSFSCKAAQRQLPAQWPPNLDPPLPELEGRRGLRLPHLSPHVPQQEGCGSSGANRI